ncbi:hypothetical protein [Agaribacter marinus]|uniref:Uncharacterized protein n=1 Tax=Agaribacter marinus TaxID=1431249 RepID=A0AA37WJM7_9ALTE|nr:hypothetical protein [Agaribacter marinus]GLR70339.1 hypothetical protein GCM10007852_12470 [Agaribacter marinus]
MSDTRAESKLTWSVCILFTLAFIMLYNAFGSNEKNTQYPSQAIPQQLKEIVEHDTLTPKNKETMLPAAQTPEKTFLKESLK